MEARLKSKCFLVSGKEYNRLYSSKNCRKSPFELELWIFDENGHAIHAQHAEVVSEAVKCIYLWNPQAWHNVSPKELRVKSDFFCKKIMIS